MLIFASPNALSRISSFRCLKCKHGAHKSHRQTHPYQRLRVQMSKMQAWCSLSCRQTHPYPGFRLSDVYNASVVLTFGSPNAPLSRIPCFRCLKYERGAYFRVGKGTPIEDFVFQMFKMRVWRSCSSRQMHLYPGFRVSDV